MHTLVIGDGWARRRHAQQDLVALDTEVGGARERVASLRSQIDGLRQRSEVQEHVIRDELGYLRPGDVIVNVGEAASAR
jgi:cell division protein FtsB